MLQLLKLGQLYQDRNQYADDVGLIEEDDGFVHWLVLAFPGTTHADVHADIHLPGH